MMVVIDYGLGNLGSIANMLQKIGAKAVVTSDPQLILDARKLILPGVGAFDNGMANLEKLALVEVLQRKVRVEKVPVLGICLGAQLMTRSSEEGRKPGLGWLEADTIRFFSRQSAPSFKVPHMGWSEVVGRKPTELFRDMESPARFYFVHSYHFLCEHADDVLTTTFYGYEFPSAFERGNIFGVQFHPEKSHKFGMRLLQNFAAL